MQLSRVPFLRICWLLALITCLMYYVQIGKGDSRLYGDAMGYYMYLPTTFIYHNHTSIEHPPHDKGIDPKVIEELERFEQSERTPKGYALNQYTYGVALLELPFFLVAHWVDGLGGGNANGYSTIYLRAIEVSSCFYAALGLILTY